MGELIGVVTPEKNGLMPAGRAFRSISKDNQLSCCLKIGIRNAGETFFGQLSVTEVGGNTAVILIAAIVWNDTKVYCKLVNGVKGNIRSLSYFKEENFISLYINNPAYAKIEFAPFSVNYNSSVEVISSIPTNAVNIEF